LSGHNDVTNSNCDNNTINATSSHNEIYNITTETYLINDSESNLANFDAEHETEADIDFNICDNDTYYDAIDICDVESN
jgi:hypothetical protein